MRIPTRGKLRGNAYILAGLVVSIALLVSTMCIVYTFMKLAAILSLTTKETLGIGNGLPSLKVVDAVVFSNGTLRANITNDGPEEVEDLASVDIIVSYTANSSPTPVTYLLSFSRNLSSRGVWTVRRVFIGNHTFSYSEHPYLMPGETVEIEALLPSTPLKDSEGMLIISTPDGAKAKRSFVVR